MSSVNGSPSDDGVKKFHEIFGLFVPFYVNIKVHSAILSVEGRATQMCCNAANLFYSFGNDFVQSMNCDTEEVSIGDKQRFQCIAMFAAMISKLTNVKHQNP